MHKHTARACKAYEGTETEEKELNSCCLVWHWRHRDPGGNCTGRFSLSARRCGHGTGLCTGTGLRFVFVTAPKGSSGITLRDLTTSVKKLSTIPRQERMEIAEKMYVCTQNTVHPSWILANWHREMFTRNGSSYYISCIHRDKSMM